MKTDSTRYLILSILVILSVVFIYNQWQSYDYNIPENGPYNLEELAQIGDLYGKQNTLFAGIALVLLGFTFILQILEFRDMRKALTAQKDEMKKSTLAQTTLAQATLENTETQNKIARESKESIDINILLALTNYYDKKLLECKDNILTTQSKKEQEHNKDKIKELGGYIETEKIRSDRVLKAFNYYFDELEKILPDKGYKNYNEIVTGIDPHKFKDLLAEIQNTDHEGNNDK